MPSAAREFGLIDPARPVNRACRLTRGLTAWFHLGVPPHAPKPSGFGLIDLRRTPKTQATVSGTVGLVGTGAKPGLPGAWAFNAADSLQVSAIDDVFPSATEMTVLSVHRKTDTTLRGAYHSASSGGFGTGGWHNASAPHVDGTVFLDWGGTTEGATRLSATAPTADTAWHWWAFTVGGGLGMRVYYDGGLFASNSATPSRTLGSGLGWYFNQQQFASGDECELAELVTFGRALSAGEVRAWMRQSKAGHPDTLRRAGPAEYLWFGDRSAAAPAFDPAEFPVTCAVVPAAAPWAPVPY